MRKIIQIAIDRDNIEIAICDDGTLWHRSQTTFWKWVLSPNQIPQDKEEEPSLDKQQMHQTGVNSTKWEKLGKLILDKQDIKVKIPNENISREFQEFCFEFNLFWGSDIEQRFISYSDDVYYIIYKGDFLVWRDLETFDEFPAIEYDLINDCIAEPQKETKADVNVEYPQEKTEECDHVFQLLDAYKEPIIDIDYAASACLIHCSNCGKRYPIIDSHAREE